MKRYEAVVREFAEETTLAARRALGSKRIGKNRSYGVATRKLQKSLEFTIDGNTIRFGSPVPYAAFVHWGVNGTRKNRQAPFSYRKENPSQKHVDAIVEWMRVKPVRLRDPDGKFIKQTESKKRSAAYAIARGIKRNGVPGVKYWTEGIETMLPRYQKKMVEAYTLDLFDDMFEDLPNVKRENNDE